MAYLLTPSSSTSDLSFEDDEITRYYGVYHPYDAAEATMADTALAQFEVNGLADLRPFMAHLWDVYFFAPSLRALFREPPMALEPRDSEFIRLVIRALIDLVPEELQEQLIPHKPRSLLCFLSLVERMAPPAAQPLDRLLKHSDPDTSILPIRRPDEDMWEYANTMRPMLVARWNITPLTGGEAVEQVKELLVRSHRPHYGEPVADALPRLERKMPLKNVQELVKFFMTDFDLTHPAVPAADEDEE